jgi:hypothetical protein
MKRTDAFMLGVAAFMLANCASYVLRSGAPHLAGWGLLPPGRTDINEAIGFPWLVFGLRGGLLSASWAASAADLAVAAVAGCLCSRCLAARLPPMWPGQSRGLCCLPQCLVSGAAVVCATAAIATGSRSLGLVMRNVICFAGPVAVYAAFRCVRRAGWGNLAIAAAVLVAAALAVDARYQSPPVGTRLAARALLPLAWPCQPEGLAAVAERAYSQSVVGLTVIRTSVPVFGLLSLGAVMSAISAVARRWASKRASKPGGRKEEFR